MINNIKTNRLPQVQLRFQLTQNVRDEELMKTLITYLSPKAQSWRAGAGRGVVYLVKLKLKIQEI